MNIKKFTLLTVSCLSAVAGVFLLNDSAKEQYFPRSTNAFQQEQQSYTGYLEYMKSIRDNRETGTVSSSEVNQALKQASKMKKGNKALGLTWNFKGPDNVGGRTRAIIIDNADTTHLYVGSVSGGIWESFDAGLSWSAYDDNFKIQNVSAMAQASNGDVYVATGPHFDGSNNNKQLRSEFVGNGVWKLTGNGNSDLIVGPSVELNYGVDWATTSEIAIDPNNSQRIFVAMNRGLRESTDGGTTWTNPLGISSTCQDVHITADGKIAVAFNNSIRVSLDNGTTWNTTAFSGASRIELAIAPSNTDIMYAAMAGGGASCTRGVYRSNDGGLTWTQLLNHPDYMRSLGCQGFYDNTLAVFPNNPDKIVVGGVTTHIWRKKPGDPDQSKGEWKVIATTFGGSSVSNDFYVHADQHFMLFHPTNPNKLYIGSDGGVGFSANMNDEQPTYGQYNQGYNVTQFYDIGVGPKDYVVGGTQDNGTQLVGLGFNTGKSAVEVRGGDGFEVELFTIDPTLGISSLYFGDIARLQGIGTSLNTSTINNAQVYSGRLATLCGLQNRCSEVFYTTVAKWESFNDLNTKDSVITRIAKKELPPVAIGTAINYNSKNNGIPLSDTTRVVTFPSDTSTINPNSPSDTIAILIDENTKVNTFVNAFDTITVNENTMTVEFKYRGKGAETKAFVYGVPVSYTNIFHNDLSRALPARLPLSVTVNQDPLGNASEIVYIDPDVKFNYEFEYPDIVQSKVALFNVKGGLSDAERNIWITKDLQKGSSVNEPRWLKIAGERSGPNPLINSNNAICATFSNDGDKLFYGTSGGDLYRVDNLNAIDLSQIPTSATNDFVSESITKHRKIGDFGNRAVTGIAVDPKNSDNMIVTLGNYGSTQYIQRSTNATDSNLNAATRVVFTQISGAGANKLPDSPIYEAVIDFQDSNKVIIGTELGVFATDNAFTDLTAMDNGQSVIDVKWTEENNGIGRAPVMAVKQMTFSWAEGAVNQGKIYLGTHGRGIYESDNLVGISSNPAVTQSKEGKNNLTIYPNPTVSEVTIEFAASINSIVNVQVFSLTGQLVKEFQPTNMTSSNNKFKMNVEELNKGTYIIRTLVNGTVTTGKFIKR